jgi:CubicO group peptidase (beta-lactamase class C family)
MESANTPSPKIEHLNGDVSLGEYFQKYIFDPLGVTSTTFDLTTRPDLTPRLATIATRTPTRDLVTIPAPIIPSPPIDHCGGIGLYSTAEDYIKILTAVLTKDPRILKPESVEGLFTPQLKDNGKHLMKALEDPIWQSVLAKNVPRGMKATYGLGGMLNLEGTPTGRKPGAIQWGGMPNLFWVSHDSSVA